MGFAEHASALPYNRPACKGFSAGDLGFRAGLQRLVFICESQRPTAYCDGTPFSTFVASAAQGFPKPLNEIMYVFLGG